MTATPASTSPAGLVRPAAVVRAAVIDLACVVLFVVVGRATHGESIDPAGVTLTAVPFLAALVIGWGVSLAWRAPARPVRTGIPVWAATLVLGMLIRMLLGQGTAVAFVVVTAILLAIVFIGWRLLATAITRARH